MSSRCLVLLTAYVSPGLPFPPFYDHHLICPTPSPLVPRPPKPSLRPGMCGSYILHLFAKGTGASWPPWKPDVITSLQVLSEGAAFLSHPIQLKDQRKKVSPLASLLQL